MKKNINKTSKNVKRLSPKVALALAAATVASGAVGTTLSFAGAKAAMLGWIPWPN
jgi:hypothetical protein